MIPQYLELSQMLIMLFNFVAIILTLIIGILAFQKVSGTAGKLIGIGAMLKVFTGLSRYFIQFFLMRTSDMNNISQYFTYNSFIGRIGQLLFLIGIFILLKNLLTDKEYSDKNI